MLEKLHTPRQEVSILLTGYALRKIQVRWCAQEEEIQIASLNHK